MTQQGGRRIADGVRVVEIGSSLSAAMAGMVMADAGAEVIQVEPPGGSPLRAQPGNAMWARGKQSLVADLREAAAAARVVSLLGEADVALIGLKPASAARFGVDHATLAESHPALVHVSVSGFGSSGPYRDVPCYDGSVAAKLGRMWDFSMLHAGERPAFAAGPVLAHAAAMLMLQGAFGALRERLRTGAGQRVETSLAQAYSIYDMMWWWPGSPMALRLEDIPFLPYPVARTKDGIWLQFAQNGPALFAALKSALDLPELGDYGGMMSGASSDARERRGLILKRVSERTWKEWQEVFDGERNISVEPFAEPGAALSHPQFEAIGDVVELKDPERGLTRQLGPLMDCPSLPLRVSAPAPALDSLGSRGFTSDPIPAAANTSGAAGNGLLSGVTVLELGMWIALPFAGALLADLGARVIKLEPLTGDPMRGSGPTLSTKMVQGKETVCLDLKAPESREIVVRLVERADVLLHSYRPGVPERLGIDFETLRAINPRLVHLYNGSYGSTGPKAFAAAFHVTGGAVCGGAFAQAGEGTPPPADQAMSLDELARVSRRLELSNEANPDFNSAVSAAASACMGLYASELRGEAVALETRMMLSNAYMMSPWFVDYPGCERPALPDAELNGLSPLYRLYAASEGWIFLAASGARDLTRLSLALAEPSLSDAKPEALAATLEKTFRTRDADTWERDLTQRGISCMRADIGPFARWGFDEPWVRDSGLVCDVEPSELGRYSRYGACVTSERPAVLRGGFPAGQHTRSVLVEIGYSDAQIAELTAKSVVATPS